MKNIYSWNTFMHVAKLTNSIDKRKWLDPQSSEIIINQTNEEEKDFFYTPNRNTYNKKYNTVSS